MSAAYALEAPVVVPLDPESLDATRPADIDACPACIDGAVLVPLGDGEYDAEACRACGGTGVRGAA
jgi:hypothetical protein